MTGSGEMAGLWNRAAADYERSGAEFFGPLGRELVTRARLQPGDQVLDVGTGRGHVLFPAAEAVGSDGMVTGIDIAAEMVRLTAAEVELRGLRNVSVRVGDAADPGLPAGSVDAVLGGFMMFLLPDPEKALRAYARVLRSPGHLAFSTYGPLDPHLAAARSLLRELAGIPESEPDVFDDEKAMADLVGDAGFDDVTIAEIIVETRFADIDQWWRWAWSVGIRASLERIDPARLDHYRPVIEEQLSAWRQPEDTILMPTAVRFTTASV